jgi:hypothetical protein
MTRPPPSAPGAPMSALLTTASWPDRWSSGTRWAVLLPRARHRNLRFGALTSTPGPLGRHGAAHAAGEARGTPSSLFGRSPSSCSSAWAAWTDRRVRPVALVARRLRPGRPAGWEPTSTSAGRRSSPGLGDVTQSIPGPPRRSPRRAWASASSPSSSATYRSSTRRLRREATISLLDARAAPSDGGPAPDPAGPRPPGLPYPDRLLEEWEHWAAEARRATSRSRC